MQISSFQTFWIWDYFTFLKIIKDPKELCLCGLCPLTLPYEQLKLTNCLNI